MEFDPAVGQAFRRALLMSPGERREVDYKRSVPCEQRDDFTLKLLRHLQGMANAGGGWLVIGYVDSLGILVPDEDHADAVCATYDPTQINNKANRMVERGQRLDITVHLEEHPINHLHYPIIRVAGFARGPYISRGNQVATDSGEQILRQGAIYLRKPGAETAEISSPADWEDLITRCVQQRRDEFLIQFQDLFERMTGGMLRLPDGIRPNEVIQQWTETNRRRALGG